MTILPEDPFAEERAALDEAISVLTDVRRHMAADVVWWAVHELRQTSAAVSAAAERISSAARVAEAAR